MRKLVIFLFLLSLNQHNVEGCKKSCGSKSFRCPIGWPGQYEMPTFESGGNCWVVDGYTAKDKIASNCWPGQYWKARNCLDTSDSCSGPFTGITHAFFEAACFGHDMCYAREFKGWSLKNAQHHCDNIFYDNMKESCDGGSWFLLGTVWTTCQASAWVAYLAVWDQGTHWGGGCWLNENGRKRSVNNITLEKDIPVALDVIKRQPVGNKRQHVDEISDFDQNYKEFQGTCWNLFGHNTDKIWNETQPLMNKCKKIKKKKKSVKCWRKIKRTLKMDLENEKASLIECIDVESNSLKRINLDAIKINKNMTREDGILLRRSNLWKRAELNDDHLLDLEDEAVETIENTWEQNEGTWNECWKKSVKIARKKGIEKAEQKIRRCWKMDMDSNIQKELSITT